MQQQYLAQLAKMSIGVNPRWAGFAQAGEGRSDNVTVALPG